MFKKFWAGAKEWWENTKPVVLNFVLPKIQEAKPFIVEQIKKAEGKIGDTPEQQAQFFADLISNYIKRQL